MYLNVLNSDHHEKHNKILIEIVIIQSMDCSESSLLFHFPVKSTGFKRSLVFIEFKQTYTHTHTNTHGRSRLSYYGDVAYRSSNKYTTPVRCAYTFHLNIDMCFIFDFHEHFAVQMMAMFFLLHISDEFDFVNLPITNLLARHAHRIHQIYILIPNNKYPFSGDTINRKEVSCWIGPETGNRKPSSFIIWLLKVINFSYFMFHLVDSVPFLPIWFIFLVWLYVVRIAHLSYWPLNTFSSTIS